MSDRLEKIRTLVIDGATVRWCAGCRRWRAAELFTRETCAACSALAWKSENKLRLKVLETGKSWDVRRCAGCGEHRDAGQFMRAGRLCRFCENLRNAERGRRRRAARQQEARS